VGPIVDFLSPSAIGSRRVGTTQSDMSSAPTTLVALYNAFTALIGYPQNMDATLTRRLEG